MNKNHKALKRVPIRLFAGTTEAAYGVKTAINKKRIMTSIYLSELGLDGDECADPKNHGGLDRALHHYPEEHYSFWEMKYGINAQDWKAPGMGENISSKGMTEDLVHIGDRYQLGETVVEISQPRSPCFKLNKRWQQEDISAVMQNISYCGWLYRVIQPGIVECNSELMLLERDTGSLSVKDVCDAFFGDPLNVGGLSKLMELRALSSSWLDKVESRLKNREVENWSRRLQG